MVLAVIFSLSFFSLSALIATGTVEPAQVDTDLAPGEDQLVRKRVSTPDLPSIIDVCLLQDETGSFSDDIANLQGGTTASDIYDAIVASTSDAQFAVAGFRDYPEDPYGVAGDHVYHLESAMSASKADWLAGITALSASGGNDIPEAQYDAIVAATGPGTFDDPEYGEQDNCGWRDQDANPGIQRILVVTTDAPFHTPDGTHMNSQADTIAALTAEDIIVVGLEATGAGAELDALAAATGGNVQPLSSDGSDIAEAILSGLSAVTTDVWWETDCDDGLSVTLDPDVHYDVPGGDTVAFAETIAVDNDPGLAGEDLSCVVTFIANSYPEDGAPIGRELVNVHVPGGDETAPIVACQETVNPHGNKTPPAGSTTLPGPKGGENEDGFYELLGRDNSGEPVEIFVTTVGYYPEMFGPYSSGDKVKITEAPGAAPNAKTIGSAKGQAGAIAAHITLNDDPVVIAYDAAGNAARTQCLVPPLPK
jgi:hypothetical protein